MKEKTVVIYSKPNCVFCQKLKNYCKDNEILYYEIVIGEDITVDLFRSEHPSIRSVPAVFIDKKYIGGYTEFIRMNEEENNNANNA